MHFHCLHGAWHGAWVWNPLKERLSDAGHQVTAPDLPGLGERRKQLDKSIDLESHIVASEPPQPCWLIAHSYAGIIAKALIDRYPEKVLGVILIEALWPAASGQAVADLLPREAADTLRQRANEYGNGWRLPPPLISQFGIKDKQLQNLVAGKVSDQPLATFLQPLDWTNSSTPKAFMIATDRKPQPYEDIALRLNNKGCTVYAMEGGHHLMLTNTDGVLHAITDATQQQPKVVSSHRDHIEE